MLTTPSLRAKTAVDQSVMLTPGGPLDDTRFDKFNLLVEADPGVAGMSPSVLFNTFVKKQCRKME